MKKILIFLFLSFSFQLFRPGAAFAEYDAQDIEQSAGADAEDQKTSDELKEQAKPKDDFTGKFWILYGINGSLVFTSRNSEVARKVDAITGQKNKLDTAFVGVEFRLGYNINHWLGIYAGGVYSPFGGGLDFITVTKHEEYPYPGAGYGSFHDNHYMYDLSTDIEYKEYFGGVRARLGQAGGLLFSWLKNLTNLYWFGDFGIYRREMTVEYSSHDFGIEGITDKIEKTSPYFGMGTEIMFGPGQSININAATAAEFLSKFGATFGVSILFKQYF